MYRGFNLELTNEPSRRYINIGKEIKKVNNEVIKKTLDSFLLNNGSLDGSKIISEWFPEINSHIFLSHSHHDEDIAMNLAGLLYESFNIFTFVDSTVWGYSNDLLKKIDDKYCMNNDGLNYNYDKRNYSTAHVNLMLSTALNKMIDNCECLLFLNSPNSISTSTEIINKTNSPWIFSEISTSKIIRKRTPERLKEETRLYSAESIKVLNESNLIKLSIEYETELSHLKKLTRSDIIKWLSTNNSTPENALDELYHQHPIDKKFLL